MYLIKPEIKLYDEIQKNLNDSSYHTMPKLTKENQYPIFRYMDEKYLTEFFDTGKLRIPSLEKCRHHDNSIRKDDHDGQYIEYQRSNYDGYSTFSNNVRFQMNDEQGNPISHGVVTTTRIVDGYVLSTSVEASLTLQDHFSGKIMKISNPIEFANEIYKSINNNITVNVNPPSLYHVIYSNIDLNTLERYSQYFLKKFEFVTEKEFRIVFPISKNIIHPDYLYIDCPNARKFCEEIELKDTINYYDKSDWNDESALMNFKEGIEFHHNNKYRDAIECYDACIKIEPCFVDSYFNAIICTKKHGSAIKMH